MLRKNRLWKKKKKVRSKVNSVPDRSRANERACELLATYFDVSKGRVTIVRGKRGRNKIIEIN